ncbi:hypothetical protein Pyrde_1378 [Pyrodictium delaneyi]|uniref:Uncharacterized protein n=1 Tax=Pyrodictium delaneyi TaxID=1273541 RepID=A0A0P0N419_9CREN|nr:hypothetical protein [Pyrodictium delaneyi]ALL01424.1 hypothetical protein Pyrde_1378 [Pyrodictium delaneyi]OWJ54478.1 hypothetical protein Pdsh_06685 [Pyrodictium delaneyi]OWJ54658.1 hypothetical protein Pdsh_06470 [Pyrodictium delaneyi]
MSKRFERMYTRLALLAERMGVGELLAPVVERLAVLYSRGVLGAGHVVLELVAAGVLAREGYTVSVEEPVDGLIVDVLARMGRERLVVEVETGYTPPRWSHAPLAYHAARLAAKTARYSRLGDRFALAYPLGYAAPIHPALLEPPWRRSPGMLAELKSLVDRFYQRPPIPLEAFQQAHLDAVLLLDPDNASAYWAPPSRAPGLQVLVVQAALSTLTSPGGEPGTASVVTAAAATPS